MAHPRVCVKQKYPNQGVALKMLRSIRSVGLPKNRQQRAYWCEDGCGSWHLTSQPLRESIDLADADLAAHRQELKVYETPDVARAAVFVAIACTDVGDDVSIAALVEQWRGRYPRHDDAVKRVPGRGRLLRALQALESVGIVHIGREGGRITVLDIEKLQMVAANRDIFEDRNGIARPPSRWPRNPEVPPHLRDVQASLVAAGEVGWKRVGKGIGAAEAARQSTKDVQTAPASAPIVGPLRRIQRSLIAWMRRRPINRSNRMSLEGS